MLLGQVSARRKQTFPSFLTDLGLDAMRKVLKNGLFLEFIGRRGYLLAGLFSLNLINAIGIVDLQIGQM